MDNRILLLLIIIIMSLHYVSLICLVGDDDDDIQQILQKEGVGHDNMMIINDAKKNKLANLSSILVKHKILVQIDCHGTGSAKCILTINMVCMCVVYVCTSYNCP